MWNFHCSETTIFFYLRNSSTAGAKAERGCRTQNLMRILKKHSRCKLQPIFPAVECKEVVATSCLALKLFRVLSSLVWWRILLGQCKHRCGPCDRDDQLNNSHQALLPLMTVRCSRWTCRKILAIQDWKTCLMTPNPFPGRSGWYGLSFAAEEIESKLVD